MNTPLQKAQARMAEMRADGWKPVVLTPTEKAKANPTSKSLAIRAHCWECVGGENADNARAQVRDCPVMKCALRPHRPWQSKESEAEE